MIDVRGDMPAWKGFFTSMIGGMAVIALYAGLLAIGFSRMAQLA